MAKVIIDAEKIKIEGENLKAIAKDYNTLIEELYTKLTSIQNEGVWVSESSSGSANKFIEQVLKDKPNHQNLATSINNLGDRVINYANNSNKITDNVI